MPGRYLPGEHSVPPGKKLRLAAGVAAAGVCVLLAACSPVKMGAAAIVGNQRISSASLASDVSDLQTAIPQVLGPVQYDKTKLPNLVLSNLVSFSIRNKTAQNLGIAVSQSDIDAAISWQYSQNASSVKNPEQVVVGSAVPPQLANEYGRYWAIWLVYLARVNNGKFPTQETSAVSKAISDFSAAECQTAKSLNVQVNPQFGNLSYDKTHGTFTVVAGSNPLSGPAGAATPSASPLSLAC